MRCIRYYHCGLILHLLCFLLPHPIDYSVLFLFKQELLVSRRNVYILDVESEFTTNHSMVELAQRRSQVGVTELDRQAL